MSILDPIRDRLPTRTPPARVPEKVPRDIHDRVTRGRAAMRKDANKRRLYQKFWEGDQYWYLNAAGELRFQTAGMVGIVSGDKANHRIRNTYNWVQAIVEAKVSAATQRVPGYEITPSTDDPEDEAAASLASQVAIFGYDKWRVRRHTTKAVTNAFVQREGFVMPYFDPNVGPYVTDPETGKRVGRGEIKTLNLSRDEVMWEPGMDFEDSPWWGIERARLKTEVEKIPGFFGELETDAQSSDAPEGKKSDQMVLLTEVLERPCPDYPDGRRMFIANRRVCVDYRRDPACEEGWEDWWEPYPGMDATGEVSDEPVIHRISYTVNPNGDDLGLTERVIDLQRTISDCWNKILEVKNRCLVPQMVAPKGANMPRRDDTPGATWTYTGQEAPQWEKPIDPAYIGQLITVLTTAKQELRELASDIDVQADARLSTGTANAAIQQGQARWGSFLGDLAEFHSRLMRHYLTLVARYYDQQRQIDIRGQYSWEPLPDFTGQDLRSQVNVRVAPDSLQYRGRQEIREEIQFIQTNWPGAIPPEAALGVLHGGSAEGLIRTYVNHVNKARRVVRRLRTGPDAIDSFGTRFDPTIPNLVVPPDPVTGARAMGAHIPNWMPAAWDNIPIWRTVIGDYMNTEDYERLDPVSQDNFQDIWRGLDEAEQLRAAKQAAQQQMQAQSLGMGNAAKGTVPPPLPDRAGFTPENSSPVEAPA